MSWFGDFFQILRPATQDPTKFATLRPVLLVSRLDNVIVLPAFAFTGLVWKGASQLLVQYNITLPSVVTLPVLPNGAGRDFCLCIRWRVGTTPYRFKLWQNVGEVLYPPTLYVNEIVKSYATLEVWTTPASTVTNSSALNILTSLRSISAASTDIGPIIDSTGVQRVPNNFGVINPTAGTNVLDYLVTN